MKKIKELAITDKNGNVGYIDLTEIDSNKTDISSLQNRVKALEDGDFQYADKDYSNPENYSDMVIGTYYMVPFNENNEYVSIDSEDLHHFDVLVRTSRTENPKKIRTQYVQANIKDVAYTNKDNTFTGDNYFSGSLKVSKFSTDAVTKDVTTTDLEITKSVTVELNQTDFTETDSEGNETQSLKNLASLNIKANSASQVSELTVDGEKYKLGIRSSEDGVQAYAPVPDIENSDENEIATVSNVRNLKNDINDKIELFRSDVNTDMTSVRTDIANNRSQIDYLQDRLDNKIQLITNEEDANAEGVIYFLVDEIPPAPPSPEPEQPTEPTDPEQPEKPTEPTEPEQPSDPTDPEQPEKPSEPTEPEQPTENPSDPKDSGDSKDSENQ